MDNTKPVSCIEWFYSDEITAKRRAQADALLSLLEAQLAEAQRTGATVEMVRAQALQTIKRAK